MAIAIELEQLLEILGLDSDEINEQMGPLAKAYASVMEQDGCPMDTLARFGLDGQDVKEAKPIINHVKIMSAIKGLDLDKILLSLFLAGLFTGLEIERKKHEKQQ